GKFVNNGTILIPSHTRANGGTHAGTSAHSVLSATHALIVPNSFSANQGDQDGAVCDLTATFISTNGFVSPVTMLTNQTLTAQAYNASHRMGPVYIDGQQLTGLVGVTITTGITTEIEETDGAIYPQAV